MYDIGIIGAGPAGSTLARLLADRYRILLLDSGRKKCCGGILAPDAQMTLAKFDLALPKQVLVSPQPFAVSIMDWDNQLVRSYARQYANIDRSAFDHWLLSLVPPSVDIRHNAVYQNSESYHGGTMIRFKENGELKTEHVRWLVGADGAFSTVRREFFANVPMPKQYIAVQHWFETDTVSAAPEFGIDVWSDYVGIFDSSLTDFYMWMIPKCDRLILGGAFPKGTNIPLAINNIQKKLESLGLQLGTPFKREAGQIVRPLHRSSFCFGDEKVILIGEAVGFISPSSAEGISSALISAAFLAEAFGGKGFNPQTYRLLLRNQLRHLWFKKIKIPLMFNPFLRKFVMLSGLTALKKD